MNIIHVENLIKKFGTITAVDNIQLNVESGQMFGFLGPNGAGKSTTIKILATLLRPTAGKAVVAGFDVLTNPNEVRRSIGLVFQDQSLDDRLTAQENLWFHAMLYDLPSSVFVERADDVLRLVDLLERMIGGDKSIVSGDEALAAGIKKAYNVHVQKIGNDVHFQMAAGAEFVPRLVSDLAGRIKSIQVNEPSLEDVFLRLTRHSIRVQEGSSLDQLRQAAQLWRRR